MNDLLKLLSNSLKPFGYHIRQYNTPNILKIRRLESSADALRRAANSSNHSKDTNTNHLIIYLRTCLRSNRNVDLTGRITGVSVEESTLRCIRSLVASVNYARQTLSNKTMEVIALDDRSGP
jgi:hypothetical protein